MDSIDFATYRECMPVLHNEDKAAMDRYVHPAVSWETFMFGAIFDGLIRGSHDLILIGYALTILAAIRRGLFHCLPLFPLSPISPFPPFPFSLSFPTFPPFQPIPSLYPTPSPLKLSSISPPNCLPPSIGSSMGKCPLALVLALAMALAFRFEYPSSKPTFTTDRKQEKKTLYPSGGRCDVDVLVRKERAEVEKSGRRESKGRTMIRIKQERGQLYQDCC